MKNENERLGMHIKGGLNGQRGNPIDPADEGVFVSKINSSGAARRDGRLKVSSVNSWTNALLCARLRAPISCFTCSPRLI